ncbi:ribonucleases P/MRP protein subunit POP1 [Parasteatoda tepidariorum]|uniref:ribonucleases P/MRP protein subunit POP1 n=1 Tax=Parasteatoda tepidariorum TaxID=114398 RepID=UPI00077FDA70|nr:ribonucleases P/MRP protein subunit POP1 [Parasteatoda tepidariorum]XP_015917480.1 ribonucleases P/MRP protein subunit POP1 [Parasteatoda tepidariorum]
MDEFSGVNVIKFAEARASEIASLMNDVNHIKKNATQKLPPHMRRRAASHNPRRVPRKLRKNYLIQNPNAVSKPKKAPKEKRKLQQKKKHEKQAKNYPEEYASRSRPGEFWLGTHIWHAKRCKMDTLWGYKLPIHCNDKKLGATHQAATKHAMLMDLSYYCCISLEGPEDKLLAGLTTLTDPDSGSNFGSAMYRDGMREGHTVVYHPFKFPYEAIGPVTFIWKPITDMSSDSETSKYSAKRSLWIWCHPSFHNEFVDVLVTVFKFEAIKKESATKTADSDDIGSNENVTFSSKVNLEKVRQHFFKENIFANSNVQMSLLKDKLVRHRIIGPNSQSVLTNVLELAEVEDVHQPIETVTAGSINKTNGSNDWSIDSAAKDNQTSKSKSKLKHPSDDDHYPAPKRIKSDSVTSKNAGCNSDSKNVNVLSSKLFVNGADTEADSNHVTELAHNETGDGSSMKKLITSDKSKKSENQLYALKMQCWWKQYYNSEKAKSVHRKGKQLLEYLRNIRSGYYIAPNSVIGLTVKDPRLILSRNKDKFVTTKDGDVGKDTVELLTEDIADSPLWNGSIRDEVTATQIPESEINDERAQCIVPSESNNLGDKESRVPILLIHQPGTNGFGSGWDLIAPLGWSMAFWIPLVLNGGRVTGIRDLHFVNLEIGKPSYPLSYPDTKAGKTYEEKQRVDELTTYFKRPKAKRPNFATFGTPNPYFMPWDVLVVDWLKELKCSNSNILFPLNKENSSKNFKVEISEKDPKNSFFVLRQKEVRLLQNLCERLSRLPRGNKAIREIDALKQLYNEFVLSNLSSEKELKNSLVLIRTKCLTRGCPSIHSGVYALDEDDFRELKCNPNFLGPKEHNHTKSKNVDKLNSDCSSVSKVSGDGLVNKEPGDCHISSSSVPKVQDSDDGLVKKSDECQISSENQIDSKSLDRPLTETLKSFSSRKMIGYLSEGGFSSISGKGCGIGHCSLIGLLFVIRDCIDRQIRPVVLVREQHSFQYRVSSLEIIPNYL